MSQTGRSKRLKVDDLRKWTVLKSKSGRSKRKNTVRSQEMNLDGLQGLNWTVQRDETERPKGMKLDGPKG